MSFCARARPFAPRPYEIVVLSDHGQTQGATFKQRHGYGLDELVLIARMSSVESYSICGRHERRSAPLPKDEWERSGDARRRARGR